MNLSISACFRSDHTQFVPTLPPSNRNPGGGVATKLLNLKAAIPSIKVVTDIAQAESINITECLWFNESSETDSFQARVDKYVASKSFKILWTSDTEFARWQGEERDAIFDASDIIAGNSKYMVNILRAFAADAMLLTDPIDVDSIKPASKRPQVFGIGNVGIEKNIDAIINIFEHLDLADTEIETFYIGSPSVWGLNIRGFTSKVLDRRLTSACDFRVPNASRKEVRDYISPAWGYVADSRYDTFCYGMVEAMLAGCWLFCGKHLIYNERPCLRFDTPAEAAKLITETFEEKPKSINNEAREHVIENYSLEAFRSQLTGLIGGNYGL